MQWVQAASTYPTPVYRILSGGLGRTKDRRVFKSHWNRRPSSYLVKGSGFGGEEGRWDLGYLPWSIRTWGGNIRDPLYGGSEWETAEVKQEGGKNWSNSVF